MSVSEKLPKSERIHSERCIDALFKEGRRGQSEPLRYCFRVAADTTDRTDKSNETAAVAIMVSVPKKSFKRAWKRNLIKRRIKESYRRRKQPLIEKAVAAGRRIDIAFICAPSMEKGSAGTKVAKKTPKGRTPVVLEIPDFKTIDNAVAKIIGQILERS